MSNLDGVFSVPGGNMVSPGQVKGLGSLLPAANEE